MHFSGTAWNFIAKNKSILDFDRGGIQTFKFPDPYLEQIVLSQIDKTKIDGGITPVLASDININWIEDNLLSIGLFGGGDSFLVLHAESLTKDVKDYFKQNQLDLTGRFLIFTTSKDARYFTELAKKQDICSVKITPHAHWKGAELLQFLCKSFSVSFSRDVENYLLDSINMDDSTFLYQAINILNLHFQDCKAVTVDQVKELIFHSKVDNFLIVDLFVNMKFGAFWTKISELELTFDQLRTLLSFVKSHLNKMYDTSYVNDKKSVSAYDKKIIASSSRWPKEALLRSIRGIAELELMAKSKDDRVYTEIKKHIVKSLRN